MLREIRPESLLRQAEELATDAKIGAISRRGRPRSADLRRATSAAYYAVFHMTIRCAVAYLLQEEPSDVQVKLARSFDHMALAQVCRWIGRAPAPKDSAAFRPLVIG